MKDQEWIRRFDGQFSSGDHSDCNVKGCEHKRLKEFIAAEIETQRAEAKEEERREVLEVVDGMTDFGTRVLVEGEKYVKVADLKERLNKK